MVGSVYFMGVLNLAHKEQFLRQVFLPASGSPLTPLISCASTHVLLFSNLWLCVSLNPSKVWALWCCRAHPAHGTLSTAHPPLLLCLTSCSCLGKPSLVPVLDAQF